MSEVQMIETECPTPEPFKARMGGILFISILFFLGFISRFIFAPLMPTIEQEQALTHSQAGSLFFMISLGVLIAQPNSGFVSSRVNHRGSLILSSLGVGLALLAYSSTSSLWLMRAIMLMLGIAAGLHLPSAVATITAMIDRQDWGKALSVHQIAPPLSLVSGPLLAVLLMGLFPWRVILFGLGVLSIAAAITFGKFSQDGDFPGQDPRPDLIKIVLSLRSFWILVALFALGMGGHVGIYTMLPLYLVTERGMDIDWANTLLGLSQVSGLFMIFIAGWIADKVGEKRAISCALFSAGGVTVLLGTVSGSWLTIIVFLQAALITCYFPPAFSAMARIVQPNMRSVAASLTTPLSILLGSGVLPTFIGYMGENYTFGLAITIVGVFIMLGAIPAIFLILLENTEDGC